MKKEVAAFRAAASKNLRSLSSRLSGGTFKFTLARGVAIPKNRKGGSDFRPIVVANIESRIVQRSVLDALLGVADLQRYIHTPYSFGGIRKRSDDDLAAVPAAVKATLDCISSGANFVLSADISGFFTRVPKPAVARIVAEAVGDEQFIALFQRAITVELSNLAALKEKAGAFPTHDIGVAQGNSLSPLLGNILLYDFDREMNEGDCKCIRYIDDVLILAPSKAAAKARLRRAEGLLAQFNMKFGAEKSQQEPISVADRFEFLGIEFCNGLIRPTKKAQTKFLGLLRDAFNESSKGFRARRSGAVIKKELSLLASLRRIDGIVQGWGKHYRFCNDGVVLANLDEKISEMTRAYLGAYSSVIKGLDKKGRREILGLDLLTQIERNPLEWPKRSPEVKQG